ncbi:hypothetical protein KOL96_24070 [Ralstonia wenshanensis]|uniref:hypothetical protein n=1 Tax=Ralstonia wenshanensis TaxID=2842456 RepID=UPI001E327FCC|nr:hypothetical protein [Ralstonia wenshanensis]UGS90975.1 hypothetical protein KOL96_24070 [Ralstonia wenshanensis]
MPRKPQIPSVELQTVQFVQSARAQGVGRETRLSARGFHVAIEYAPHLPVPDVGEFNGVVAINDVYVPVRYRRRGWFSGYVVLCALLADQALIVADAYGPLREALLRQGFVEVFSDVLILTKTRCAAPEENDDRGAALAAAT